jgi:hypothetical protein
MESYNAASTLQSCNKFCDTSRSYGLSFKVSKYSRQFLEINRSYMGTYLSNILEMFMALLVDSCFLQVSPNSNVLPQENFTMIC